MIPISIIVPVYNTEEYLSKTIECILNQTFKDFELIFVNDGSVDKSLDILENYAKIDSRIKIINQENMGVSAARNNGLAIAKGKYVTFIDSDDIIDSNMLEVLFNNAEKFNVDISCCGISQTSLKGVENREYCTGEKMLIIDIDFLIESFFSNPIFREVLYGPYNKIILREIAQKVKFNVDYAIAEDLLFNFECLENINSFYFENIDCYHYIKRENSASTSKFSEKQFHYIYVADILLEKCRAKYPNCYYSALVWTYKNKLNMCRALVLNKDFKIKYNDFYRDCFEFCKKNFKIVKNKLSLKMKIEYLMLRTCPASLNIIRLFK